MPQTSTSYTSGPLELLDQTRDHRLLTPAEEVALARRVERGDKAATEQMVLSNLRLVVFVARRFQGQGLPLEDLVQEGTIGLSRAVEKFDYRRGHKFSTYATWWIRQACQRAVADQARTIRLPVHVSERRRKLMHAREEFNAGQRHEPTLEQLAEAAGIDPAHARQALEAAEVSTSLNKPIGGSGTELGELIPDLHASRQNEDEPEDSTAHTIHEAMRKLPEPQRSVIALRFGFVSGPRTQEDIAQTLKTSPRRIRILEREALRRLRDVLPEEWAA